MFTVSGLDPDTTYYWKVVAIDDGSPPESRDSATWSFTTAP
jgi:hypothetical protein